jgi:hypothetical protein
LDGPRRGLTEPRASPGSMHRHGSFLPRRHGDVQRVGGAFEGARLVERADGELGLDVALVGNGRLELGAFAADDRTRSQGQRGGVDRLDGEPQIMLAEPGGVDRRDDADIEQVLAGGHVGGQPHVHRVGATCLRKQAEDGNRKMDPRWVEAFDDGRHAIDDVGGVGHVDLDDRRGARRHRDVR